MLVQRHDFSARGNVPSLRQVIASSTTNQSLAVRGERDASYRTEMGRYGKFFIPTLRVPELNTPPARRTWLLK